jgi:hypothetical protein
MTPLFNLPDGTLVRVFGDPRVYVVQNGELVWIPTLQDFNQHGYNWRNVKNVSKDRFEQIKKHTHKQNGNNGHGTNDNHGNGDNHGTNDGHGTNHDKK